MLRYINACEFLSPVLKCHLTGGFPMEPRVANGHSQVARTAVMGARHDCGTIDSEPMGGTPKRSLSVSSRATGPIAARTVKTSLTVPPLQLPLFCRTSLPVAPAGFLLCSTAAGIIQCGSLCSTGTGNFIEVDEL